MNNSFDLTLIVEQPKVCILSWLYYPINSLNYKGSVWITILMSTSVWAIELLLFQYMQDVLHLWNSTFCWQILLFGMSHLHVCPAGQQTLGLFCTSELHYRTLLHKYTTLHSILVNCYTTTLRTSQYYTSRPHYTVQSTYRYRRFAWQLIRRPI